MAGTSVLRGDVDFGGGADTLMLAGSAAFHGALANSAGLAITSAPGRRST